MRTWKIAAGLAALIAALFAGQTPEQKRRLPEGPGLAAKYPGDSGIGRAPEVVFAENFEEETLGGLSARWDSVSNKAGNVLSFGEDVPASSSGRRSLRMVATRGENEGGHLFKVLRPGYERLFLRFYVRFGAANGFNHHFVSLGGEIDPPPYPVGRAGLRPEKTWNSGIEPADASHQTTPATPFGPPGIWHFYTYWPEMRSWQNDDGTGSSFYGNNFEPRTPVVVPRGKWVCVEVMVRMNSSPEHADGEQAFWIDGKLAADFGPHTVKGKWMRDRFRIDEEGGTPFEGIRWRRDPKVNINKLWLSHYVSEAAFKRTDAYANAHPGFDVDTRRTTVWFDDLVLSKEYVGPIQPPDTFGHGAPRLK